MTNRLMLQYLARLLVLGLLPVGLAGCRKETSVAPADVIVSTHERASTKSAKPPAQPRHFAPAAKLDEALSSTEPLLVVRGTVTLADKTPVTSCTVEIVEPGPYETGR